MGEPFGTPQMRSMLQRPNGPGRQPLEGGTEARVDQSPTESSVVAPRSAQSSSARTSFRLPASSSPLAPPTSLVNPTLACPPTVRRLRSRLLPVAFCRPISVAVGFPTR